MDSINDTYKGTITRRMDSVLDGLQTEFRSLYSREDFNRVLDQLDEAKNQSNRPSILKKLFDMLDSCDVSYERGKSNAYYEDLVKNMDIPADCRGVEDEMLYALYQQYQKYPTPEEYLNRIVERLRNQEDDWGSDTLRVKILKQFVKYGHCLTYKDSENGSKVTIYGGEKYIKDYLGDKTGVKVSDVTEAVDMIDDHIFDILDDPGVTKDQKKPANKYGILKMADDLAGGKFRAEGATKRSLYLFAMVYGMTYYSGDTANGEILDYRTDIEVNLFRDYYVNNLMRYISDEYKGHMSEFELDPSGQGINYKNFAEMIYLYYISRTSYLPEDKIRLSDEMINRLTERGRAQETSASAGQEGTVYYRKRMKKDDPEDVFSEDILNFSEPEFEQYLYDHYDCNTYNGASFVSAMQLETDQNTAYQVYMTVEQDLDDLAGPEPDAYGLWITDVNAYKKGYESLCERRPDIDRDKFSDLMELLQGVNAFMTDTSQRTKDTVTRASLIVAYYYYYNAYNEINEPGERRSFEEVFDDFKSKIDMQLEEAFYQPLSSKSIFDVLVAFSAYAYENV